MTPKDEYIKSTILAPLFHSTVLDKTNKPSVDHPWRVSLSFNDYQLKTVALLHDTIEDTKLTVNDLKLMGYSQTTIDAVVAITKRDDEKYMDYIKRVALNPLAKQVKIADLNDNLNRNDGLPEKEKASLSQRYRKSLVFLQAGL